MVKVSDCSRLAVAVMAFKTATAVVLIAGFKVDRAARFLVSMLIYPRADDVMAAFKAADRLDIQTGAIKQGEVVVGAAGDEGYA